jgi:hypothetical protein
MWESLKEQYEMYFVKLEHSAHVLYFLMKLMHWQLKEMISNYYLIKK